uniref:Ankyrin repeat protein n=1 Tax=Pithovirus LCPAC406 TaxID=2506599 RepID=A0A481ZFW3_9VIRU|nr:MAG: ankyrin repeat protein [Pithovirus LCPAC406]
MSVPKSISSELIDRWKELSEDPIAIVLSYLDFRTIFPLDLFIHCAKLQTLSRDKQRKLFQVKCEQGLLSHAKWIKNFFNLTSSDARWDDGRALNKACKNGHLKIVVWLCTTFQLVDFTSNPCVFEEYDSYTNDYDILGADGWAFSFACKRGHLEIVTFFVNTYSDLIKDLGRNKCILDHSLYVSMENGHIQIIRFFVDRFILPVKSNEFYNTSYPKSYEKMVSDLIQEASYYKHTEIAQYLEKILMKFVLIE